MCNWALTAGVFDSFTLVFQLGGVVKNWENVSVPIVLWMYRTSNDMNKILKLILHDEISM